MRVSTIALLSLSAAAAVHGTAKANDVSDVARQFNVPMPVVETVILNVDAYFASPDAPVNRMTSGIFKELALKAAKSRMSNLEDSTPGKSSESSVEERNAAYKATVRTIRHESSENAECVDNTETVTSSEGVPTIKDGSFVFDNTHPKVSSYSWKMTFCRTPLNGGGSDFTEWQLK
jgi:hypothetical protein